MKYRVTRPNGTSTEVEALYWETNMRGEVLFRDHTDVTVRAFAQGAWAEVETIEPDPFTAATAAIAGASP